MNILFVGKDNFLSKAFINQYKRDHRIDKAGNIDYNDVGRVRELFQKRQYDILVYNAYEGYNMPVTRPELMAFRNVQYEALAHDVKRIFILAGATDLYPGDRLRNADESRADLPPPMGKSSNPYLVTSWAAQDDRSCVLRFFYIFGDGVKAKDDLNKIINGGFGKAATVRVESDMTVSGIYIGDALKIIMKFLKGKYGFGSFNIISSERITLYEAARKSVTLAERYGKDYSVNFRSIDIIESTASNLKLLTRIGAYKFASLNYGINKAYENAYGIPEYELNSYEEYDGDNEEYDENAESDEDDEEYDENIEENGEYEENIESDGDNAEYEESEENDVNDENNADGADAEV